MAARNILLAASVLSLALAHPPSGGEGGRGGPWGYPGHPGHGGPGQDDWRSRIKNVVVLIEENRSFDTMAGGFTYSPDINGLVHTKYCNPSNLTLPNSPTVCAQDIAQNVAPDDPNHGISGVNYEIFGTYHPNEAAVDAGRVAETMAGFVTEQGSTYATQNISRDAEAINFYTQDHVRVLASMAENYVLFDRWFASVPGPTNPNRAYLTSGTSHGHGRNDADFALSVLPQRSIFQQLSENNITWTNYYNSSFPPDAMFYSWTVKSGANKTNVIPLARFYEDAAAGTLPQFTYINPECCSYDSFHPPSPITTSSNFVKGIYEAVRNSPQWNETLFIMSFDENGGFGDHVPPPVGVPAGDSLTYTETAPDGKNMTFNFERLGVRVPTIIMSPWVEAGVIEHQGSNAGGEYTHTSIIAFLDKLWGLEPLTPRVAYSSSFEHLITNKLRTDAIVNLPNPYPF